MASPWTSRVAVLLAASQPFFSSVSAQNFASSSVDPFPQTTLLSPLTSGTTPTPSSVALPSPSPSGSSEPKVHLIKAGAGGFKFEPQSVSNVSVGDIISWEFYPPDHSVARAEYGSACVPYEYTGKDKVGFWSETQWVDSVEEITHYNVTINSTEPIFFYCAAPNSCKGELMVGVINPNGTQTLDGQIRAARSADFQVAPGEAVPKEATSTLLNAPTGAPSAAPAPSTGGSHKLSGGAIAGIVVGAVAFLVICAALFFYVGRSKSLKEVLKRQDATIRHTSTPGLGSPEMGQPYGHQATYPYSPAPAQSEFGANGPMSPPMYGQHNVAEQYPSAWSSPGQQGHLSGLSTMTQQQIDEIKAAQAQQHVAELHSPTPAQQGFAAELEAPGQKK